MFGENVAQAMQFAQSGAADAAIVALSLALAPNVEGPDGVFEIPSATYPRMDQGGVILRWAADPDAARALRGFLLSADGRAILERSGFRPAGSGSRGLDRALGERSAGGRDHAGAAGDWDSHRVLAASSRRGAGSSWSRRSSRCRSCCRRPSSASTCWWRSARAARSAARTRGWPAHGLPFTFEGLLIASVLYSLPFAVQPFARRVRGGRSPAARGVVVASACRGSRRSGGVVLPLSVRGLVTGIVLSFAHTLGEFGVVLMVGGNLPGVTRTVSISIYDAVQALDYAAASRTSLLLLIVSFVILVVHLFAAADGMDQAAALAPGPEGSVLQMDVEQRFASGFSVCASLDVRLRPGSMLVLFGPSGAGKTTILRQIAGLERPDAGTIRFGDEVWCDIAGQQWRPPQERRVGVVFQEPTLFPHLTVRDNIRYGVRPGQIGISDCEQIRRQIRSAEEIARCWGSRISKIATRGRCRAGKRSGSRWRAR